jgi:hypothetical protein
VTEKTKWNDIDDRSPPAQLRGENDPKKDSGLESGEVSDASEGVQVSTVIKLFLRRLPKMWNTLAGSGVMPPTARLGWKGLLLLS